METSDNKTQFLTVKQFSQISGLSETTVRRRVKDQQIDAWQPGGAGTRLLISRKYLQGVCDLPLNPSADTPARRSQNDQIPGPKPKWKQS
ncbi:helix-turn-helix domain-containing protein [Maioricimonas sp. JC845]|uniref:helix-turn-helix domain-containing protein n=1 Tax=Maioricimonas sp. JC845 TaxID=3232138 RepID=UPI00345AD3FC